MKYSIMQVDGLSSTKVDEVEFDTNEECQNYLRDEQIKTGFMLTAEYRGEIFTTVLQPTPVE